MNIWGYFLKIFGWRVKITAPRRDKTIICVAPHTSNWDFILGLCSYRSMGRKANFLMKEFWFFFPLSILLKSLGGIPVAKRSKKANLTEEIIRKFESSPYLNLAVTPEGTRSRVNKWRTGFLYISYGAHVPIQLGVIDYKAKEIIVEDEFNPSGNVEEDMKFVKSYYSRFASAGKYPEKFSS